MSGRGAINQRPQHRPRLGRVPHKNGGGQGAAGTARCAPVRRGAATPEVPSTRLAAAHPPGGRQDTAQGGPKPSVRHPPRAAPGRVGAAVAPCHATGTAARTPAPPTTHTRSCCLGVRCRSCPAVGGAVQGAFPLGGPRQGLGGGAGSQGLRHATSVPSRGTLTSTPRQHQASLIIPTPGIGIRRSSTQKWRFQGPRQTQGASGSWLHTLASLRSVVQVFVIAATP